MNINTENLNTRFQAVAELNNLVDKHRELRLGQLIYNAFYPVFNSGAYDFFDVSDDEFLQALKTFREDY